MRWTSHLGLIVCCTLSAVMIAGTVSWMESSAPQLTADDALIQAKQSISQYCLRQKLSPCSLKLVNATAPSAWLTQAESHTSQWQFQFYSPQQGTVEVKVPENGQNRVAHIRHI